MMRPVEKILGKTGAYDVTFNSEIRKAYVHCRNSMTGKDNIVEVDQLTGRDVQRWLEQGKPGLIQEVFPNLTIDQRETMISGISPEEWDDMFAEDERFPGDI